MSHLEDSDLVKSPIKSKLCMSEPEENEVPIAKKPFIISAAKDDDAESVVLPVIKESKIVTLFPFKNHDVVKFSAHVCSKQCLRNDALQYKGMNVLSLPMYVGFERHVCKINQYGSQLTVCYRAPCGKMLRSLRDVYMYLRQTGSSLKIQYFSFSPEVFPFRLFTVRMEECLWFNDDVTNGVEKRQIPCVNMLTKEQPPLLEYIIEPIPGEDVPLKQNKKFLCYCDCTDNCLDSLSCQCQQLTNQLYCNKGVQVGYYFKRLKQYVLTGIYECNSQCSCSKEDCLNRVAQNDLEIRLQLFKTEKKGWGIRCIDDLDSGTFLCNYVGEIHSDQVAEKSGTLFGDEYFAELDHIEVAEKIKNGYEANVAIAENEYEADVTITENETHSRYIDNNNTVNKDEIDESSSLSNSSFGTWSASDSEDSDVDFEDQSHFTDNDCVSSLELVENQIDSSKFKIRKYFGEDNCYVMNAKNKGNIARYFNHSCSPNVFTQNVFIETHDLRFPTVAFFTASHVKAGTELTWDYNYKTNSVENKVLYCYCGSKNCRGRLL